MQIGALFNQEQFQLRLFWMSSEHLNGFLDKAGGKEMGLSFINYLLFIRGVSCSRLTMNAITNFSIYLHIQMNRMKEYLINKWFYCLTNRGKDFWLWYRKWLPGKWRPIILFYVHIFANYVKYRSQLKAQPQTEMNHLIILVDLQTHRHIHCFSLVIFKCLNVLNVCLFLWCLNGKIHYVTFNISHWNLVQRNLILLFFIIFKAKWPKFLAFILSNVKFHCVSLICTIVNFIYLVFWTAGWTKQDLWQH